jgi:hypothetical protein
MEGSGRSLIQGIIPQFAQGLTKATKNLALNSLSSERDL